MPLADELLLAFYRDERPDAQGRTLTNMLAWSDATLEAVHDYIQWLFPLPEVSGANPSAPLLTPRVQAAFRESDLIRGRMRAAWLRMLRFYGFTQHLDGAVVRAANFPAQSRNWLTPSNHNHLRLTRMLRSLHLAGLPTESEALFQALSSLYAEPGQSAISPLTFRYWQRARE
ncbi:MAG TPA: opioid growth factor receptor-related protein [Acidobacteriaceae bacterium]